VGQRYAAGKPDDEDRGGTVINGGRHHDQPASPEGATATAARSMADYRRAGSRSEPTLPGQRLWALQARRYDHLLRHAEHLGLLFPHALTTSSRRHDILASRGAAPTPWLLTAISSGGILYQWRPRSIRLGTSGGETGSQDYTTKVNLGADDFDATANGGTGAMISAARWTLRRIFPYHQFRRKYSFLGALEAQMPWAR